MSQASNDSDFTIQEAKLFIGDVEDARRNWMAQAIASWQEIKKVQRNGKLWSVMPNSARKAVRFPLWNSIYKIRIPLVYSREPVPVGVDTSGGNDPVAKTAAIALERLAKAILKTFDFSEAMLASCSDTLVTNLGVARAYYIKEDVLEKERVYLIPSQDPITGEPIFLGDGDVPTTPTGSDEQGAYIELDSVVSVKEERVYLEPTLYSDFYFDPAAIRWSQGKIISFPTDYTRQEFKRIFGKKNLENVPTDLSSTRSSDGKRRNLIRVHEIWNWHSKETKWMIDGDQDFIEPKDYAEVAKGVSAETEEGEQRSEADEETNGLYNLRKFFPCVRPMIQNAPTDSFYPVTEYYQICDQLAEIHTIASRIFVLSRAIRIRGLFDSTVSELQSLVNEVSEADWIGVSNLAMSLANGDGDIRKMVAYLPIAEMVAGLENMYKALDQRLNMVYQLTGTSDLLRGQTDGVERTYGEQQMKAKYAMNQLEPMQQDMQRFAAENMELLCEMALKNFSDESLDEYIVPSGMDPSEQASYPQALEMLKSDRKRQFRIQLETDSTIALNEEYDKQMKIEVCSAISKAIESTANIIEKEPILGPVMVQLLEHLASGFRQGKQFQDEIKESLGAIIEKVKAKAEQPPQQTPPDPAKMAELQQKGQIAQAQMRMEGEIRSAELNLEGQRLQQDGAIKSAELQQKERIAQLEMQIAQMQEQTEIFLQSNELQAELQRTIEELAVSREKLQVDREKLMGEAAIAGQSVELDAFRAQLEAEDMQTNHAIATMQQQLETWRVQSEEKEKWVTEERLQREEQHRIEKETVDAQVNAQAKMIEAVKPPPSPVSYHINVAPHKSKAKPKAKDGKN